jgi:diguanylate cyclase (GGDEF)-like protein
VPDSAVAVPAKAGLWVGLMRRWDPLWRIAIWVVIALAVLAMSIIELDARARSAAMRAIGQESAPTAVSYGILLQSEIEKQRLVPFILANDPDVLAALVPGPGGAAGLQAARMALNRKFEMLCAGTTAGVIYVLDDQGRSVASSNWDTPVSFVGQDYSYRPYFTEARESSAAEYFASGKVSHLAGLFVSHWVLYQGKFVGVVVVKVQFGGLESTWAHLGGNVFVVDEHGIVIITSAEGLRFRALQPLTAAQRQVLRRTQQYGDAPLEPLPFAWRDGGRTVAIDGHELLAVTAQIPTTDWVLYLLQPLDPALASAGRGAAFGGIVITVLVMALALFVRGRVRQYFLAKAKNEEMRQMAITDALTLLPNRRAFETNLRQLWHNGPQARGSLAALMVDVDHFKLYNDFYGHPAGDECLRRIADILRQNAKRSEDLAARYGGEEFTLLLPNTDLAGAARVAETVRTAIRGLKIPHETAPGDGIVTVSIGVAAAVPKDDVKAESLVAAADRALYDAKKFGRDCVACGG